MLTEKNIQDKFSKTTARDKIDIKVTQSAIRQKGVLCR